MIVRRPLMTAGLMQVMKKRMLIKGKNVPNINNTTFREAGCVHNRNNQSVLSWNQHRQNNDIKMQIKALTNPVPPASHGAPNLMPQNSRL